MSEQVADRDIMSAFDKGQAAARRGVGPAGNPFRPLSDEELYQAWELGRREVEQ